MGNFFGVTEESQHGTADSLGWEQVSGIRIEVRYMCVCVCVWEGGEGGREEGKEGKRGVRVWFVLHAVLQHKGSEEWNLLRMSNFLAF